MFSILRQLIPFVEKNDGSSLVQRTSLRISNVDRVRQIIRHEMFRQQQDSEHESFEEADDFDLPDDEQWVSPYEERFEPEPERVERDQSRGRGEKESVSGDSGTVAVSGKVGGSPQGGTENSQSGVGSSNGEVGQS